MVNYDGFDGWRLVGISVTLEAKALDHRDEVLHSGMARLLLIFS